MKLVSPQGKTIVEASHCAEILNNYFKDQFCEGQQVSETVKLGTNDADLMEVTTEGLIKLINGLSNWKCLDIIRKSDFLVDARVSALCLKHISQLILGCFPLSGNWRRSFQIIRAEIKWWPITTVPYHSPVFHVKRWNTLYSIIWTENRMNFSTCVGLVQWLRLLTSLCWWSSISRKSCSFSLAPQAKAYLCASCVLISM